MHMRFPFPTALVLCAVISASGLAQQTLSGVTFTNQTGTPKDGLRLVFNQALDPNQPTLAPSGGTTVPPFPNPPTQSGASVEFSGASIPAGGSVPSNGETMTFSAPSTAGLDIVQATWRQSVGGIGFVDTNTVALFTFYNFTGSPADTITFSVTSASGATMNVVDISFPSTFQPTNCATGVVGGAGMVNTLSTTCCVTGLGSPIGPIQLTFDTAAPIGEVNYTFSGPNGKVGSAADQLLSNDSDGGDGAGGGASGALVQDAAACSIAGTMPIDDIFPRQPFPLPDVVGFGAELVYLSGGLVLAELGFDSAHIVITSTDPGPENIRFDDVTWFRPALGVAPELLYFTFDEADGTGTLNRGTLPVGNVLAPVVGHLLSLNNGQFDLCLTGAGGFSTGNFVDTGWATDLQNGFTVACWLRRGGANIPPNATFYLFGDPSAQFECSVTGEDVTLQVGPDALTIPGGFPQEEPAHVLFTYSETEGFKAYMNGLEVATGPATLTSITGNGPFKVGGSGSAPAIPEGVLLDEFRLYDRDLTLTEVETSYNSSLESPTSQRQWQINSPEAHLDLDGIQGDEFAPADITQCFLQSSLLTVDSVNAGSPWELVLTGGAFPMKPRAIIDIVTPDGQVVNMDLNDPQLIALNAFAFNVPFVPILGVPFGVQMPRDLYGQFAIGSATTASGIALSAPVGVHFTALGSQASIVGPTMDDSSLVITPGTQPLCGPPSLTFAGSTYSDIYVNSNGTVTFGQGDVSFFPTVEAFTTGPPKVAGLWADLSPSAGGTISTSVIAGVVTVDFLDVPDEVVPGTRNSFTLSFGNGSAAIVGYAADPLHRSNSLVGLSPGPGASDPGPVDFASLVGMGVQFGSTNDVIYQLTDGAPPNGFYSITFPSADGSSYIVE